MIHDGYKLEFVRRRYGRTTYTWIYLVAGEKRFPTGDPVPKIMPSKDDRDRAIRHALQEANTTVGEGK